MVNQKLGGKKTGGGGGGGGGSGKQVGCMTDRGWWGRGWGQWKTGKVV